jgi:hypothetical protein
MDFGKIFEPVGWKPTIYNNRLIQIADILPTDNKSPEYKISFVEVNSDWEQGIFFHSKGAHFEINSEIERLNACHFWQTEMPKTNTLKLIKKGKTELKVWNIWRIEKGPMSYGSNGAALIVEQLLNGRKYYCNDGYPDEDFNDLIFEITWEK